ncbi:MAG: alpha/beta hydrolase [Deltaproteobacteria bacterium]|nr:alpha/beta hydrolase [Deltaproteobacteria bacterium]
MNREEANIVLAQLKSDGRVRRWFGLGARAEELFETFSRIKELGDWCKEFGKVAHSFEKSADSVEDGLVKSANYLSAASYYHIGLLGTFEDNEERIQAYRSVVRVYDKARKDFRIPAERVEYPFGGITFSAYFRQAPGVTKPPCVILMRGLDACREVELHTISSFLLEKGLSTLAIDTVGQGEARFQGFKLIPDVSESVGAALDYLEDRPEIDSRKIAILGQSFAGYLAVRTASREKRIKACVSLGSFYSLEDFEILHMLKHNCMMNMKVTEDEWPQTRKLYSLEGVIEKMTCPFLAVNGSEDVVIPPSQTVKMYERARGPKDLKIYEGAPHCVYYDNKAVLFYIADWLLQQFKKTA